MAVPLFACLGKVAMLYQGNSTADYVPAWDAFRSARSARWLDVAGPSGGECGAGGLRRPKRFMDTRPLIVGLGSHHGDDAVGWHVAEALARRVGDAAVVRTARSPADVLDWTVGVDWLLLCDGCRGSGPPGCVRRWTWPLSAPALAWSGTHDLGLLDVMALAERLGRLPRRVYVWTVEVEQTASGQRLSPRVAAAVPVVVDGMQQALSETAD
jgi:hydrogenase maturation protease